MLQTDMKKKNIIIRTVTFMLTIMVFFIIFNFSSQNSDKSTGTSNFVINAIININPFTNNLEVAQKEAIKEKMKMPIRKLAHFSIYTILGITTMCHMSTYAISKYKRIGSSLSIGVLYAISDEIHQLFVSGRSGQMTDVLIDSTGVLFGIGIVLVVRNIIMKNKKIKKEASIKMQQ